MRLVIIIFFWIGVVEEEDFGEDEREGLDDIALLDWLLDWLWLAWLLVGRLIKKICLVVAVVVIGG